MENAGFLVIYQPSTNLVSTLTCVFHASTILETIVILLMLRGINRIHKQLSGVLTTKSQLESIRIGNFRKALRHMHNPLCK